VQEVQTAAPPGAPPRSGEAPAPLHLPPGKAPGDPIGDALLESIQRVRNYWEYADRSKVAYLDELKERVQIARRVVATSSDPEAKASARADVRAIASAMRDVEAQIKKANQGLLHRFIDALSGTTAATSAPTSARRVMTPRPRAARRPTNSTRTTVAAASAASGDSSGSSPSRSSRSGTSARAQDDPKPAGERIRLTAHQWGLASLSGTPTGAACSHREVWS
jgi:hypothetical protein